MGKYKERTQNKEIIAILSKNDHGIYIKTVKSNQKRTKS